MIEFVKQGVNSRIEDLGLHARRPVTEQGAEQRDGGLLLVAAQQAHDAVRKDGAMRIELCHHPSLGRVHRKKDVLKAYDNAGEAGFENINLHHF